MAFASVHESNRCRVSNCSCVKTGSIATSLQYYYSAPFAPLRRRLFAIAGTTPIKVVHTIFQRDAAFAPPPLGYTVATMLRLRQFLARIARRLRPANGFAVFKKPLTAILLLAVLASLVWVAQVVPEWQVKRAGVRAALTNSQARTTPADVAALENELRKTLLQVLGGLFAIAALWFTYRRVRVAEQGHITDRYTRAIEQLGALRARNQPNIEVRLGAIYALERIALDSPRDHWTIMEVLTAYVRQNAPAPAQTPTKSENQQAIKKGPSTEIQAILTVLGRRPRGRKRERDQRLDLSNSDLRGANLDRTILDRASFFAAHLDRASFNEAQLAGARFDGAHLDGARFNRAHLAGARFNGAQLDEARFDEAHLAGARFIGAQLDGARFTGAQLDGATFDDAQLAGASFFWAQLDGADFRRAEGLTAAQFRHAQGWQTARFDEPFAQQLRAFMEAHPSPPPPAQDNQTAP